MQLSHHHRTGKRQVQSLPGCSERSNSTNEFLFHCRSCASGIRMKYPSKGNVSSAVEYIRYAFTFASALNPSRAWYARWQSLTFASKTLILGACLVYILPPSSGGFDSALQPRKPLSHWLSRKHQITPTLLFSSTVNTRCRSLLLSLDSVYFLTRVSIRVSNLLSS